MIAHVDLKPVKIEPPNRPFTFNVGRIPCPAKFWTLQ
jgi:hypothetical protein